MYLQYINITAAKNIFLIAPQIKRAFDIDVFDEDEIERHIEAVLKITLLPDENETSVSLKAGTKNISEENTSKKISS